MKLAQSRKTLQIVKIVIFRSLFRELTWDKNDYVLYMYHIVHKMFFFSKNETEKGSREKYIHGNKHFDDWSIYIRYLVNLACCDIRCTVKKNLTHESLKNISTLYSTDHTWHIVWLMSFTTHMTLWCCSKTRKATWKATCAIVELNLSKSSYTSILLKEETDFIEPQLLWNHTKSEIFVIWRIGIVYCTF